MKKRMPALILFIVLTALLEIFVRTGIIESTLIPSPSMILQTMVEMKADFAEAFKSTFLNTVYGWILSMMVGMGLAFLFSLSALLKRAVLPFAVFFQTVPIIAIAPLLVIYFGFGSPTVIAASFIVSLFPVIANTLVGLESPTAGQLELFRVYGADSWQILTKLRLPSAYPYVYSGLRISAGLSIVGVIAGEFVAGGGLGALIDSARTQQRVDIVFACLLLLSVMGLLLLAALGLINKKLSFLSSESL
ncbi:ABC transporter permease [Bdellovibrio sp. HCB2-146]|uniref:ABC transporter permease n=1 Tax=Bdellovibrio sp. HCB2-146 TaxID=3394362 RepID=UPI0039BD8E2D